MDEIFVQKYGSIFTRKEHDGVIKAIPSPLFHFVLRFLHYNNFSSVITTSMTDEGITRSAELLSVACLEVSVAGIL